MPLLYTFEAKEIQKFILRSDKLKDMIGGSEIINDFCGGFLIESLTALGIDPNKYAIISQAAGWARLFFENEHDGRALYKVWPLLADRYAPGLQVIQSLVSVDASLSDAIKQSAKILRTNRNRIQAQVPEIGPFVERYARTGLPSTDYDKSEKEHIDRQTFRKRTVTNTDTLIRNVFKDPEAHWPKEMDHIAGKGSYVAIIHADGNLVGEALLKISSHCQNHRGDEIPILKCFSESLKATTENAVQQAYEDVLKKDYKSSGEKYIAARPIVIGGDDVTIIVRADLAFDFIDVFLRSFERESQKALDERLSKYKIQGLPEKFTACAGLMFMKKSDPFSSGYELTESLCQQAKKVAKANRDDKGYVPSCFSFHKVTSSMTRSYADIQREELTSRERDCNLWQGPYAVGDKKGGLPSFNDLKTLAKTLDELPKGSIRTLIGTLYESRTNSLNDFRRILQIAGDSKAEKLKKSFVALTKNENDDEVIFTKDGQTPLFDAHVMRGIFKQSL